MVTLPAPELRVMPPAPIVSVRAVVVPDAFARKRLVPVELNVRDLASRLPPANEMMLLVLTPVILKKRSEVVAEAGKAPGSGVVAPGTVDHAATVVQFAVPPSQ
jgi:hypothetical protein